MNLVTFLRLFEILFWLNLAHHMDPIGMMYMCPLYNKQKISGHLWPLFEQFFLKIYNFIKILPLKASFNVRILHEIT